MTGPGMSRQQTLTLDYQSYEESAGFLTCISAPCVEKFRLITIVVVFLCGVIVIATTLSTTLTTITISATTTTTLIVKEEIIRNSVELNTG